jgi:solute carrier family 34 (sodium-dependent phosphate cotransporter)
MTDTEVGIILLFGALLVICSSLIILVKVLSGMLKGSVAQAIKKTLNFDFKFPFTFVTGYIAIFVGAGMTVIVQSSSVFTSILTPLVGVGVISIERMYPLALGSNLGTTATSVLAALASPADTFHDSLQTALIHLFFNLSGVILWYPVPFLRQFPISAAKFLGDTTAEYRWFAIIYIVFVFLLIPGMVFFLSWLGWQYLAGIGGPILVIFVLIIIINMLQSKVPNVLPKAMRNWEWLPEPLRSLAPYDKVIRKILRVIPGCRSLTTHVESSPQRSVTILKDPLEFNKLTFSMKPESVQDKTESTCVLSSVQEI